VNATASRFQIAIPAEEPATEHDVALGRHPLLWSSDPGARTNVPPWLTRDLGSQLFESGPMEFQMWSVLSTWQTTGLVWTDPWLGRAGTARRIATAFVTQLAQDRDERVTGAWLASVEPLHIYLALGSRDLTFELDLRRRFVETVRILSPEDLSVGDLSIRGDSFQPDSDFERLL
jgi:hypothetical protein